MNETDLLQILQHPDISGELKSAAFTLLRRICGAFGRLPRSYLIQEDFKTEQEIPFATRGYTDLWKRDWKATKVAVKVLRFGPDDDRNQTTKVMSRYFPIRIPRRLTITGRDFARRCYYGNVLIIPIFSHFTEPR